MRLLGQWVVSRQFFYDAHFKKKLREMSFATLHKLVHPQGVNFDDVETWGGGAEKFGPRATNRVCYNCGRKDPLQCYCDEKPEPTLPRQNNSRQGGNFYRQRNRSSANNFVNNQGNKMSPLLRWQTDLWWARI